MKAKWVRGQLKTLSPGLGLPSARPRQGRRLLRRLASRFAGLELGAARPAFWSSRGEGGGVAFSGLGQQGSGGALLVSGAVPHALGAR